MNRFYTSENVKKFLETNEIRWNYWIVDRQTNEEIKLEKNQEFNFNFASLVIDYANRAYFIKVDINNLQFVVYTEQSNILESGSTWHVDKDLSRKWQEFLMQIYGEDYAQEIFDWATENKSRIENKTKENIARFTYRQKLEAQPELDYYLSLINFSKKYLTNNKNDYF